MERAARISKQTIRDVWNAWLDGDSISRICDWYDVTREGAKQILSSAPPDEVASDGRYIHKGRFFWVYASGLHNEVTGEDDRFVMVRQPRRCSRDAFTKGLRAIRRDVRAKGGDLNLAVLEGVEADVALKFVEQNGVLGYAFNEAGVIGRLAGNRPEEELTESAAPRP